MQGRMSRVILISISAVLFFVTNVWNTNLIEFSNDLRSTMLQGIHNDTSNSTSQQHNASLQREDEFAQHWPPLKQTLCPNQSPNSLTFQTLFELARIELQLPPDQIITTHTGDIYAINKFFSFSQGGLGYLSNDKKSYMAYLRIFKAGNDQIRGNLLAQLNSLATDKKGSTIWDKNTLHELIATIPSSVSTNETCIITVVRDPISHFLSAYNEIEWRHEDRIRGQTLPSDYIPKYRLLTNGTQERYVKFVQDFIQGPSSNGIYRNKPRGIEEITHVFSMVGPLYEMDRLRKKKQQQGSSGGMPRLTAYMSNMTNLDDAFPQFLHSNCRLPKEVTTFTKKITHGSQGDEFNFYKIAKMVWKEAQDIKTGLYKEGRSSNSSSIEVSRALCAIHAMDYACYDDIPVPKFCQRVYMQDHFRERLYNATDTSAIS